MVLPSRQCGSAKMFIDAQDPNAHGQPLQNLTCRPGEAVQWVERLLHSVRTYTWITGTHLKAKHGYLLLLLDGWVVRHRRIIGSAWPEISLK